MIDVNYSNHRRAAVPAYAIPLTDSELATLGRIMVIWAQVDFQIDQALCIVFNIDPVARNTLVGERMVGAKLNLLEIACKTMVNDELRLRTEAFLVLVKNVRARRNQVAHGLWSWRIDESDGKAFRSARQEKSPAAPFKPKQLHRLEADMAKASVAGSDLVFFGRGIEGGNYPRRFFSGSSQVPPGTFPEVKL